MPSFPPTDLILDAETALTGALAQFERLAEVLAGDPPDGCAVAGLLAAIRYDTDPDGDWADLVAEVRPWLTSARPAGPLELGRHVACCAAQLVVDVACGVDDVLWRYPGFASALDGFAEGWLGTQLHLAEYRIDNPATGDGGPRDGGPSPSAPEPDADRLTLLPPLDEAAVLRAAWELGDEPVGIDAPAVRGLLRHALGLRRFWDRDGRAVVTALAGYLRDAPLRRLRAEVEWECGRAMARSELDLYDRPRTRAADRPAADGEVLRDQRLTERDLWIYEQVMGGQSTYDAIMRQLRREARARGWRPLGSAEAIRQRALRYAEQYQLPPPKPRQSR